MPSHFVARRYVAHCLGPTLLHPPIRRRHSPEIRPARESSPVAHTHRPPATSGKGMQQSRRAGLQMPGAKRLKATSEKKRARESQESRNSCPRMRQCHPVEQGGASRSRTDLSRGREAHHAAERRITRQRGVAGGAALQMRDAKTPQGRSGEETTLRFVRVPAATYSPTQLPVQYHRRRRA